MSDTLPTDPTAWWSEYQKKEAERKKEREAKIRSEAANLITWCDEKAAQGELTITWDGGNDSGCYYVRLNGDEIDNDWQNKDDFATMLLNIAADTVDYGSFAGNFDVTGCMVYDPETKTFTGVDEYSEDESATLDGCGIKVAIPKDLWFDEVRIEFDSYNGEEVDDFTARLIVRNGPVSQAHIDWQEAQEEVIGDQVLDALEKATEEVNGSYNEYVIQRQEFTEDGDQLVYIIDSLEYNYHNSSEKDVTIDLNYYLNDEQSTGEIQTLPAADPQVLP